MKLSQRIKCFKWLLFIYIFILMVTGAAKTVLGGALLWSLMGYYLIVENSLWLPVAIIMCLGPITFALCWLGWKAAYNRNRIQLITFSVLIVVLICFQFIICGWMLTLRESFPIAAELPVDNSFAEFLNNDSKTNTTRPHGWNRMQSELRCCGVNSPSDYRRVAAAIPWSCCARAVEPFDPPCRTIHQRGCLDVLSDNVRQRLGHGALAAVIAPLIQSIGLFCAIQMIVLLGRPPECDPKETREMSPLSTVHLSKPATKQNL